MKGCNEKTSQLHFCVPEHGSIFRPRWSHLIALLCGVVVAAILLTGK